MSTDTKTKGQIIIQMVTRKRDGEGNRVEEKLGELVRNVPNKTREQVREIFNQMKNDVIENNIRFYEGHFGEMMVIMSPTGSWEGFKRPPIAKTRLYPKVVQLVFEGEEGFKEEGFKEEGSK